MSTPLNPGSSTIRSPTRTKKEELVESEESEGMSPFSNQTVLMVTCITFLLFVIGEVIGALAGNSWSLLGDAAAMSVDVVSYFCNMVAERIKSRGGIITPRTQLILEVYVPSTSVAMLVGVTIYVTVGAVNDIITPPEDDVVDIFMLWLFSSLNAVVDIVSAYMFYAKGRGAFYETINDGDDIEDDDNYHILEGDEEEVLQKRPEAHKNLNMISAFTHVGGDTMRTLSVFVAAAIATASSTPGYLCDAWAAVFVSLTIVITIMPLLSEIFRAHRRISAKMA